MRTISRLLVLTLAAALLACKPAPPPPAPVAKKAAPPAPKVMTVSCASADAVNAVRTAMDLADNIRQAEAVAEVEKALTHDSQCALAHALLGQYTPGAPGMTHLTQAETLAATLPEAERAYIQSLAAERRGEDARSLELLQAASTAAPGDWRLAAVLGQRLQTRYQLEESATALQLATRLNPQAGPALNTLGYVRLAQGKVDDAIAAFKQYAAVSPAEPNPHDSLAEALMAAGRYDEAETAFNAALEISPTFGAAWTGIAQGRFLQGNWVGGHEALTNAATAYPRPNEKWDVEIARVYAHACEGKMDQAMKALDAAEIMAKEQGLDTDWAFVPMERARLSILAGKPAPALPLLDEAMARATSAGIPGGPMGNLTRACLVTRIEAEADLGKADAAKATLASLEAEIAKVGDTPRRRSDLAFARGQAALAAKDAKSAAEHFAGCTPDDGYCQIERARALKSIGDTTGAGAAAQEIVALHRRELLQPWLEAQAKPFLPATSAAPMN
jgi:tetratricopeptide (TPR) repeat protein